MGTPNFQVSFVLSAGILGTSEGASKVHVNVTRTVRTKYLHFCARSCHWRPVESCRERERREEKRSEACLEVPSSRKVLSVLVERDSHNSVRGIEGLLHSITMVNINVNVQHTLVVPEVEERREKDGNAITEIGGKK